MMRKSFVVMCFFTLIVLTIGLGSPGILYCACSYTLSSSSGSSVPSGSSGHFDVTTDSGCNWTVTNNATSWLTITSGSSGSGSGTVNWQAGQNTGAARSGTLTIAGKTYTVNQSSCGNTPSLNPTSSSVPSTAGNGSFNVTWGSGCGFMPWTASSNATGWLTTSSSGTGNGTVNYNYTANSGTSSRNGNISVGGSVHGVTQASSCTYTLSSSSGSSVPSGSSGNVNVTTGSGCGWTATSNATSWLTITSGSSGSGNGTVNWQAGQNTGAARSGTLTIAGKTYTVNQSSCGNTPSLNPTSSSVPSTAGGGSFNVTWASGCGFMPWTASSNATGWLTTSSSGTGNGTVNYNYTANSGTSSRNGNITVGGSVHGVTQASSCTYTLSSSSGSSVPSGSSGNVNVTTVSGCGWTATSNATSWLTITSGSSGSGSGTVNWQAGQNTGAARSGTLTIAGKTYTVNQSSCGNATLTPQSSSVPSSAGSGSFNVTWASGCGFMPWTASSNATGWLTTSSSGTGNGTVNYNYTANSGASNRSGNITVGGAVHGVTQASTLPTVTITAPDATATEAGTTTGYFTITRTGATTSALTVNYSVSGTATPGSDYNSIGTNITIPAGSSSVNIIITPIYDFEPEADETVIVTISANSAYAVSSPNSATLVITSNDYDIAANIVKAANIGTRSDRFTVWIGNITPATDLCSRVLRIVDANNKSATQTTDSDISNPKYIPPCSYVTYQNQYQITLQIDNPMNHIAYLDNGKFFSCTSIADDINDKSKCIPITLPTDTNFSVYGTTFDMSKHSFHFKNNKWLDGNTTKDKKNGIIMAINGISSYMNFISRRSFWRSQYINGGNCYGMASSAIANFTNSGAAWGVLSNSVTDESAWKNEIDAHWNAALQKAVAPFKPFADDNGIFNFSGTYDADNGGWTLEAARKIIFYQATQSGFEPNNADSWVGKNGLESHLNENTEDSLINGLLIKGRPVLMNVQNEDGSWHSMVASQLIKYGKNRKYIIYDNNNPDTSIADDYYYEVPFYEWHIDNSMDNSVVYAKSKQSKFISRIERTGIDTYNPVIHYLIQPNKTSYFDPAGDSQNIYHLWDANATASMPNYVAKEAAGDQPTNLVNDVTPNHIQVLIVGGNVSSVTDNATGNAVPLIPYGDLVQGQAVIQTTPLSTLLYLPKELTYRIDAIKDADLSKLKVFALVPNLDGTAEVINYENLETGETDNTSIYFYVGTGNTDKSVRRTSATVQDTYDPDYSGTFDAKPIPPQNFKGYYTNGGVFLTWNNVGLNVSSVLIVRKEGGYPASSTDGTPVYQALGEAATDTGVSAGMDYFYAAYSVDSKANMSDPVFLRTDTTQYSIYGKVTQSSGTGIAGANLELKDANGNTVAAAMSGTDGAYAIPNLVNGAYTLTVTHPSCQITNPTVNATVNSQNLQINFTGTPVKTLKLLFDSDEVTIGNELVVQWTFRNISIAESIDIKINRDGIWETLATNIPILNGKINWTVTGPAVDSASLRISMSNNSTVYDDHTFKIKSSIDSTSKLVFVKNGDVWMMNTDGSNQQQITSVGGVSWPRLANGVVTYLKDGQIYKTDVQGSTPVAIQNTDSTYTYDLSPDGTKLAVIPYADWNMVLYRMNIDGSDKTTIYDGQPDMHMTDAAWGTDGYIYFSTGGYGDEADPSTHNILRMGESATTGAVSLLSDWSNEMSQGGALGSFITFRRGGTNSQLWVANTDGSNPHQIPNTPSGIPAYMAAFDQDRDVVYYTMQNGSAFDVYSVWVDGLDNHLIASGLDSSVIDFGKVTSVPVNNNYIETFSAQSFNDNWEIISAKTGPEFNPDTITADGTYFSFNIPTPSNWVRDDIALKRNLTGANMRFDFEYYFSGGGSLELKVIASDEVAELTNQNYYDVFIGTADVPVVSIIKCADGICANGGGIFENELESSDSWRNTWVAVSIIKEGANWYLYKDGVLKHTLSFPEFENKTLRLSIQPTHNWYKGGPLNVQFRKIEVTADGIAPLAGIVNLSFSGSGSGTVTGTGWREGFAASFATNVGKTEHFDLGTNLLLHGAPSPYNVFTGWTGDCSGKTDCSLTMTANRNVNAAFDIYTAHKARLGDSSSYYSTLLLAYGAALNGNTIDTIKAWGIDFGESLNMNQNKAIILRGGYNEGYSAQSGKTILKGTLTISNGSLTVENLQVQ
jgi:hypothetical protein